VGQVPPAYALPGSPLLLDGPVVTGFGRGSRQMGVPTANIDPAPLQGVLAELPLGVYFGCAAPGWSRPCGVTHRDAPARRARPRPAAAEATPAPDARRSGGGRSPKAAAAAAGCPAGAVATGERP
jgi:hypothetical protein